MTYRALLAIVLLLGAPAAPAQQAAEPRTKDEKLSYAIAVEIARRFAGQGWTLDEAMAARGFRDAARGTPALSEDELRAVLKGLQGQARQKAAMDRRIAALANLRSAEAALALNAAAPGVTTLPSGLQYRELATGEGEPEPADARLRLGYVARLLDGREVQRIGADQPAELEAATLLPGLREAAARMRPGARWQVWLPPSLAYGPAGSGGDVGPNEALVVEIHRHRAVRP